jgi:hypothetical protein
MTTTFNKLALAGTALLALGLGATNATAATVNAQSKAKIVQPLTITKQSDLDFGAIVSGAAASTVAINAAGVVTCGTGLFCSGTRTAASFTVTGSNNNIVTVSAPTTVTLSNGTVNMTANLSAPTTLNLGATGSVGTALTFGGTLNVGANQADGVYASPNFAVTVEYQ